MQEVHWPVGYLNGVPVSGIKGADGVSPTIEVGSVSRADYGTMPSVTNSGTDENIVLDFVIPDGQQGNPGNLVLAQSPTVIHILTEDDFDASLDEITERLEQRINEGEGTLMTKAAYDPAEVILNAGGLSEYIDDYVGDLAEVITRVQSDWNENDESVPGYVKNRIGWHEEVTGAILSFEFDGAPATAGLVTGQADVDLDWFDEEQSYEILIDETEYTISPTITFASCVFTDGENFTLEIKHNHGALVYKLRASVGTDPGHSFSLSGTYDKYHKISKAYTDSVLTNAPSTIVAPLAVSGEFIVRGNSDEFSPADFYANILSEELLSPVLMAKNDRITSEYKLTASGSTLTKFSLSGAGLQIGDSRYHQDVYIEIGSGGISMRGGGDTNLLITGVAEPTADNHAATKKYVDDAIDALYERLAGSWYDGDITYD